MVEFRECLGEKDILKAFALARDMEESDLGQLSVGPMLAHIWILGAWSGDELIGATQIIPSTSPDTAFVFDTAIRQDVRGGGIGDRLQKARDAFLLARGRTRTVASIAPWNGSSLNCSLNKNGARGVRYHRNCHAIDEDMIQVTKNLLRLVDRFEEGRYGLIFMQKMDSSEVKFLRVPSKEEFIASNERDKMEELINRKDHQVIGVVRQKFSGDSSNLLVLIPS